LNIPASRTLHTVSELAEILRALVEDSLPRLWVEGEISNLSRPSSGHWYFTLKDAQAQIRCAMFRNANFLVRPPPQNGDRVMVRAQASYYAARGDLQLICEHMETAGEGALLRAFEELKRRLLAEGLFDAAHKRPLPRLPHAIGLITSGTGAAVQDVLAAFARRFPLLRVFLWPVPVQGAAAAPAIVRALAGLPRRAPVDAILLVRGGGSLEDLWSFNEESVARAIRACAVPVVTGVGHETDTTIADFAADLRAPTPTAAAELITPDSTVLSARLEGFANAIEGAQARSLSRSGERLQRMTQRLAQLHPSRALQLRAQRVDDAEARLSAAMLRHLRDARSRFNTARQQLSITRYTSELSAGGTRLDALQVRGALALKARLALTRQRLERSDAMLRSLNPSAVLDRGYSIARTLDGVVIRDAGTLPMGEEFELTLPRNRVRAKRTG
jgi:exodeoxyribonuclease VII large subunit